VRLKSAAKLIKNAQWLNSITDQWHVKILYKMLNSSIADGSMKCENFDKNAKLLIVE
jgi:hypothetical protein